VALLLLLPHPSIYEQGLHSLLCQGALQKENMGAVGRGEIDSAFDQSLTEAKTAAAGTPCNAASSPETCDTDKTIAHLLIQLCLQRFDFQDERICV